MAMPINQTHPQYDMNIRAWMRARDVYAGEDAVKAAGTAYLPRLDGQTDAEYAAYKGRATFFNATARTADALVGLLFRREPEVKVPRVPRLCDPANGAACPQPTVLERAMMRLVNDADMQGTRLSGYAKNVVQDCVLIGRAGTLVDWCEPHGRADSGGADRTGDSGRAYAVMYQAEDILNWHTEMVNGRRVLTQVTLAEGEQQIRVLRLVPRDTSPRPSPQRGEGGNWKYTVEIWVREQGASVAGRGLRRRNQWELVAVRTPLRYGKPLPLIPFVFHGLRNALPDVDKMPLADIIAVNLDHYRLDADYKHGLHFTALPTAWVSGFDKTSELRIGSSTAWVAEAPGAVAGFLEFKGHGLSTFENAQNRDERLMAVLGSRMLEDTKRVGETADAIELRQAGENSILMTLALSLSDSISQVLRWVYWWNSTEPYPEDVSESLVLLQINTDFTAKGLSSMELTAIVGAWQAGAISQATMFDLFRKGEVLPTGRTDGEEQGLIQIGRENLAGVLPNGPSGQAPTTPAVTTPPAKTNSDLTAQRSVPT